MGATVDAVWDEKTLHGIPHDKLVQLLLTQVRNIWSEDGLYYIGIENRFGTAMATEIDREVWAVMGKLEARRVKEALDISVVDLQDLFEILKHTSWLLDMENKEYEMDDSHLIIRNTCCRVQQTRVKKGLGEFGCKPVRTGYLKNFIAELNPKINVTCNLCPPDDHPEDLYCEWEFIIDE
jgi:hypothetical protein